MPAKVYNSSIERSVSNSDHEPKRMGPQHMQVSSLPDLVALGSSECNACIFCADTCGNIDCKKCSLKTIRLREYRSGSSSLSKSRGVNEIYVTPCEMRRHKTIESAWIRCGNEIYDATDHIKTHPGGEYSILRKAGGEVDCTRDMNFHSTNAVQMMKKCKVGTLVPCPGEGKFGGLILSDAGHDESCTIS